MSNYLNLFFLFNNDSLKTLNNLVNKYYSSKNKKEFNHEFEILDKFTKSENSFSHLDMIKKLDNINIKIYMLEIIEYYIKKEWNIMIDEDKIKLRYAILYEIIKNIINNESEEYLDKLNALIVLIASLDWFSNWQNFIKELCSAINDNIQIFENNLKILVLFIEKIKNCNNILKIKEEKKEEFNILFNLFEYTTTNYNKYSEKIKIYNLNLFSKCFFIFDNIDNIIKENYLNIFYKNLEKYDLFFCENLKYFEELFKYKVKDNNLKNKIFEIYKIFLYKIINLKILDEEIISKKNIKNYYNFIIIFQNSLINFFTNYIDYIESFDFNKKEQNDNENFIIKGLYYIINFISLNENNILKNSIKFLEWFIFKLIIIKFPDVYKIKNNKMNEISNFELINYSNNKYLVNKIISVFFGSIFNNLLNIETSFKELDEQMKENIKNIIIYLTYYNIEKMLTTLSNFIEKFFEDKNLNKKKLFYINFFIENIIKLNFNNEMKQNLVNFYFKMIKIYLNKIKNLKDKNNKILITKLLFSIILKFPELLKKNWKLLKSATNKSIEFLNDNLNETIDFLYILYNLSKICYDEFLKINENEKEPYIIYLINNSKTIFNNINIKEKLILYECIANIIQHEKDINNANIYIKNLINEINFEFDKIFNDFNKNNETLNKQKIEFINEFILINEKLFFILKEIYWKLNDKIFIKISEFCIFIVKNIKKEEKIKINLIENFLSLVDILINNINDKNIIVYNIIPEIEKNIIEYFKNDIFYFEPLLLNKLLILFSICEENNFKDFNFIIENILSIYEIFLIDEYEINKELLINYFKFIQNVLNLNNNKFNINNLKFDNIFNIIKQFIYEFDPKILNESLLTLKIFTNRVTLKDYHSELLKIIIYLIFNPFYSKDNLLIFEIFETLVVSYINEKDKFINNMNKFITKIFNQLNEDKINEFAKNIFEKINFSGQYIDYLKEFLNNLNCYRIYNIENNNVNNNNNNNIKILKLKFLPS